LKQAHKTIAFWLFLAIVALLAFTFIQARNEPKADELGTSELLQHIEAGNVVSLTSEGEKLSGEYKPELVRAGASSNVPSESVAAAASARVNSPLGIRTDSKINSPADRITGSGWCLDQLINLN